MQSMLGILAAVELDSHRQALHHLYVVASRVLGGQEAEAIATRARQIPDIAIVVAAEGVDVDGDLLATMHPRELRLLEIRGHPDLVGLSHEHQRLSRFDSGAKLDGTSADDAVGGSINFCVTEVQQSLIEGGLCRIGISLARRYTLEGGARSLARGVHFRDVD